MPVSERELCKRDFGVVDLFFVRSDPRTVESYPQAGWSPDQGDPGYPGREVEGSLSQSGEHHHYQYHHHLHHHHHVLQVDLDHLLLDGGWKRGEVDWLRFVGLATMTISDGIQNTINSVCEILSDSPDGISANIKFEVFKEIYTYLSERWAFNFTYKMKI